MFTPEQSQAERRQYFIDNPYSFPGGYGIIPILDDSDCICRQCLDEYKEEIEESIPGDGWFITGAFVNWEDPHLYCGQCGQRIESEYSEE